MDRMNDTLAKIAKQRMTASRSTRAPATPTTRKAASAPRSAAQKPALSTPALSTPAPKARQRAADAAVPRQQPAPQTSVRQLPTRGASARRTTPSAPSASSASSNNRQAHTAPRALPREDATRPRETRASGAARRNPPRVPSVPDVAPRAKPPINRDALDMDRVLEMPSRAMHAVGENRLPYAADVLSVEAASARGVSGMSGISGISGISGMSRISGPSLRFAEDGRRGHDAGRRSWSGMSSIGDSLTDFMAELTERRKHRANRGGGDGSDSDDSGGMKQKREPVCSICGGAGYLRLDVPVGDPHFGQPIPCKCKERELAERERIEEERRLAELDRYFSLKPFHDKTFESFHANTPGVEEAYSAALSFAQDPAHSPYHWLVLIGDTGVGKTHLAAAIAYRRLAQHDSVFFAVVPDLLDHLRSAFAPSAEVPYGEMFDTIREVETLILDDLGAENSTGWATEKLFQIINHRYNHRMPTVVTTNQQMFERMDARIASRLSDPNLSRVVTINARSRRPRATRTTPPRW